MIKLVVGILVIVILWRAAVYMKNKNNNNV